MYQDRQTDYGRVNCDCHFAAVVSCIFLGCGWVSASTVELIGQAPESSLAIASASKVSPWAVLYTLAVFAGALLVAAVIRCAHRWRRRALQQRDDEIHRLIEEWTRNLQKEVSERKQAQLALQESQQFIMRHERLAAVGQLAAGLAHEFNNIMTVVQGHAALLTDNPKLDGEAAKSLVYINDGIERVTKLVRQLLAFSRQQVMQPKALNVRETLGHTSEMLGRLLGDRVALNFEIAPHLPPILADPDMFQQIIVNLVVNARDAMSSGGQLTIRATDCNIAAATIPAKSDRKPGHFVRMSVTDTGSGMDTAIINHLFEPFFTTKDVGKGTGLGLASVHGMVNQHQGWIEVESKLGKGTTFDIYFPAAAHAPEKSAEAVEATDLPEASGGNETVLVVEDEAILRELVREILSVQGYRVLEAANGIDALNVWEENRENVDLLLTDMVMPHGPSGRELADQLRKEVSGLPVVFSSGYSQQMIQNGDDAGQCTFYLSKPYNQAQLTHAVRAALDCSTKYELPLAPAS